MNGINENNVDVLVVGGGVAGLSAALTLTRARRTVVVLDAGEPRNAPAAGVHGFLSRDGMPPRELLGVGATEVTRYGGRIIAARATSAQPVGNGDGPGFMVGTHDGQRFNARRLLITTGLVDELPDIGGLRERWGRDVLHCPYCHGWEIRDQPIAVIATGAHAVHQALMFRQWSADVTLFLHTAAEPGDEQWEQLAARGIAVVVGEVAGLQVTDDALTGVRLTSGRTVACRAVAITPRFVARGELLAGLGLAPTEFSGGTGSHIASDATGLTSVAGVRVAGNVTDLYAGVIGAAAAGTAAAVAINADLIADDTCRAVSRRHATFSGVSEARVGDMVLGDRRHGLDNLLDPSRR